MTSLEITLAVVVVFACLLVPVVMLFITDPGQDVLDDAEDALFEETFDDRP